MRIGVVSDVHCRADALAAAFEAFEALGVDEVWCAGDIVLEYRFSDEVVGMLRRAGVTSIQGNHDMVLLSPGGAAARASASAEELAWLASLPYRHELSACGRRVLMVHGSPWEPYGDYLRAGNEKWRDADSLGADIVVTGHTHEPMVERFGSTLVVNPGSLGEPRQRDDRRGTFAVIDVAAQEASIHHVDL